MKLGYNWVKGPFELIDEIGIDYLVNRLKKSGKDVPDFLLSSLNNKFYNRQTALMVKKNHYRKKYILLFQMDKVLCHKLVIESEIHPFDN